MALGLDYQARAGYIGLCSKRYHASGIRRRIESVFSLRIVQWESAQQRDGHANGAFFAADPSAPHEAACIHYDAPADWMTLLVYLAPKVTVSAGTSFWQHRKTGLTTCPSNSNARSLDVPLRHLEALLSREAHDRRHWKERFRAEYRFNRAILFASCLLHSATLKRGRPCRGDRLVQSFRFKIASELAGARLSGARLPQI